MLRFFALVTSLILLVVGFNVSAVAAQSDYTYADTTAPDSLLASYFDAINRGDYPRAYGYWETPPQNTTLEQFTRGYADTLSVTAIIRVPYSGSGAAGSIYVEIPTLLLVTKRNGTQQTYTGCYIARTTTVTGPDTPWRLYRATVQALPANRIPDLNTLGSSCEEPPPASADYVQDNLQTPTTTVASLFNAITRGEYQRAYNYWETPPGNLSLQQFANGYTNTLDVKTFVQLPVYVGVGAGNLYGSVPTLLISTQRDGTQQIFAGCYVTHAINPGMLGEPQDNIAWHLYSADVKSVLTVSTGLALLGSVCPAT